jgi:hypothetical protein
LDAFDQLAATVYYLAGSGNWDAQFGGLPTAQWLPQIQSLGLGHSFETKPFGFTITWASDSVLVVEAATSLNNPIWSPLATNTLAQGSSFFSDLEWKQYRSRFYRVRPQ